jgi:transcriptional regulator with XRE-family HTH domain
MPWFSRATPKPKNWSPYRQLIIADHGRDLMAHPRMKTDADYRYAVDESFSDVRIAKQLRLIREIRQTPLTQLALAEKAEMKQSRISELEGMNYSAWSVSTLKRLAKALGVRFSFAFESWRELGPELEGGLSMEALWKPSFENDPAFHPELAAALEPSVFLSEQTTPTTLPARKGDALSFGNNGTGSATMVA